MTKMYEVSFEKLEDGTIRLDQQCGVDEPSVIDLHPEQLRFIARRMAGFKPETAGKVEELERRIAVLTDKLQNVVCNKSFRSGLIEGIGEGFEYLAKLDGLLDLAMEFDGGRLEPEYKESPSDDEKPIHPCSAITQSKKAKESVKTAPGGQLDLAV